MNCLVRATRCGLLGGLVLAVLAAPTVWARDADGRPGWQPNRNTVPRNYAALGEPADEQIELADYEFVPQWQRAPHQRSGSAYRPAAYQAPTSESIAPGRPQPGPRPQPQPDFFSDEEYIVDQGAVPQAMGPYGHEHYGGDCETCGHGGYGYDDWYGPPCGDCGTCGLCRPRCGPCGPWAWLDEFFLMGGTHAFKGPLDQGLTGNFGFHEGLGTGGALWHHYGIGYQVGAQWVHSNFQGDRSDGGLLRDSSRNQVFVTAGLFHRAWDHHGWQWGVVYDWLQDNYYLDINLGQVRTELSYLTCCGHEIGFWGAFGVRNDQQPDDDDIPVRPTDLYALFYRYTTPIGGQGRLWGGGTGSKDGLLGADFRVPVSNRFDLTGAFNYLIPGEGSSDGTALIEESWGLSMQLVWYVGRGKHGVHHTPYRPLLGVADNSVFFVDRVTD